MLLHWQLSKPVYRKYEAGQVVHAGPGLNILNVAGLHAVQLDAVPEHPEQ
jgi:hypothetical protein